LIVSDVDPSRVQRMVADFGAQSSSVDDIYDVAADIFAPCALGGIINDQSIPRLRVSMVAGGANNQLLDPRHGDLLEQRGIVYVPDYAANAGGVINGCSIELLGWDAESARKRLDDTSYATVLRIFSIARAEGISTWRAADRLAEERLSPKEAR
jgi:leucine dehydrogenase